MAQVYRPGEAAVIVVMPTLAGQAQTGLSPTIDILNNATGATLVNDGAMTEISTDGVYYYSYTTPSPSEGEFKWIAYIGTDIVATGEFITLDAALGDYRPGDTARFMAAFTQAGVPVDTTGIVADVYKLSNKSKVVNGGACTEIGTSGVYYYEYSIPSGENAYFVVFRKSTDVFKTQAITVRASTGTLYNTYSAVDTIDGYIDDELAGYSITDQTTAEVLLAMNQAIQEIVHRLGVVKDDFIYDVVANTDAYQLDSVSPWPYDIEGVWYGSGSTERELFETERSLTRLDVAKSNVNITRYSVYRDGADLYIQLGGKPSANIGSGLRVHGPYIPPRVTSGAAMPLKLKYDWAVEAIAVSILVKQKQNDLNIAKFARDIADAELSRLMPPEAPEVKDDEKE